MFGASSTTRRILLGTAAIATVVCAHSTPTTAQTAGPTTRSTAPTSTFDQYHNARPLYRERRELHLFANDTQRNILRSNQRDARRPNRRGGPLPFSLGGNRRAAPKSGYLSLKPRVGDAFSPNRPGAFSRFGNSRRDSSLQGTAMAAMERRRSLLSGSSRNAPIYRALQRTGRRNLGARPTIEDTPFVQTAPQPVQPDGPETNLHDYFSVKADLARNRLHDDAWEHFRNGEYLDAARSFGTATRMDPSNNVSRTGDLLCHFVVKAHQTSLAIFKELLQHDTDLFGHTLGGSEAQSVAALFDDPRLVGRLQSAARLRIGPSESNKDVRAMHLLMLWYLGKRPEAQRGAVALAREFPDSPYAAWPDKMSSTTELQLQTDQNSG